MTFLTYATRRLVETESAVPLIAVFGTLLLAAMLFAQELVRVAQGDAGRSRLQIFRAILVPQLVVFGILVATRIDIAVR